MFKAYGLSPGFKILIKLYSTEGFVTSFKLGKGL